MFLTILKECYGCSRPKIFKSISASINIFNRNFPVKYSQIAKTLNSFKYIALKVATYTTTFDEENKVFFSFCLLIYLKP